MSFFDDFCFFAWALCFGLGTDWIRVDFLVFSALAPLPGGRDECVLGFCKEIEFAFAGDASVPSKRKPDSKPGEFVIAEGVDGGQQYLLGGALFDLVPSSDTVGQVVGESVRVKVDDGTKQDAQLCRRKRCSGVRDDALEGSFSGLPQLVSASLLGFVLGLLPLESLPPLLGKAALTRQRTPAVAARIPPSGFPPRLPSPPPAALALSGRGYRLWWLGAWVVYGAMIVCADGDGSAYALAVDDDGWLCSRAWRDWFGVEVLR